MSKRDAKAAKLQKIDQGVRREHARLLEVEERLLRLTARMIQLEEKSLF